MSLRGFRLARRTGIWRHAGNLLAWNRARLFVYHRCLEGPV